MAVELGNIVNSSKISYLRLSSNFEIYFVSFKIFWTVQNNDVERHGCFKGPFTWRYQEDPRRLNNFTLGLKQRTFCPCGAKIDKVREGNKALKIAGDKSKSAIWSLLLSLLALISTF